MIRLPGTVSNALNARQSEISTPNYHMSIKKCKAILKSFVDLKSNGWFTLKRNIVDMVDVEAEFVTP